MNDDTIYALASARGKAGVAIVRISGPGAHQALRQISGTLPAPRRASLRRLTAQDGSVLDQAIVLVFADGESFTGEPMAELHLHGSIATINRTLQTLSEIAGLRQAEAGEFTRRALENERLDLAQVEGLADLIDAETEAQRKQALRVLSGALGQRAENWRARLLRAAALLEATIDFSDEDVPDDVAEEVGELISAVRLELLAEARQATMAERIRSGFEVAIVGPPNSGKSTLLNALAGRDAAITSEIAGTTRDVIEVDMDLKGLPVTVLDTAGLRDALDSIEKIGVARARQRADAADLRVFLLGSPGETPVFSPGPEDIVVLGRADLFKLPGVSGLTGAGVEDLIGRVAATLEMRAADAGIMIRERHRVAILRAETALAACAREVDLAAERSEVAAEELRSAIRALDSLVGRVDVEHILDEIFSSFCVGK